jgi:5-methyltetrahydrofolate--homocysteine methyltransferase
MPRFLDRIKAGEVLVADGAMGTMLIAEGLKIGDCPEYLNLARPELISKIARSYSEAGAQIIHTNTFGGSALKLASYGLDDKTEEINGIAVEIAKNAVGDKAYVSGSCGPSGKILVPYGDTQPEAVYDSFKRQIAAMIDAEIDILTVETMVDIEEAKLAIKAARDISKDIPIMATMTFDSTPDGFFTIMGVTIPRGASELKNAGADLVGSNCGNGSENMVRIAEEFKKVSDIPIIIQPNAGLPELKDGQPVYNENPEFMADQARKLFEIGVSVIGGCCGTTPEHIRAIRKMVDLCAVS